MRPNKIVIREVKGNRCLKVFDLLAECVSKASEAFHVKARGHVQSFNVACANQIKVRKPALPKFVLNISMLLALLIVIQVGAGTQTHCTHDRKLYRIRIEDALEAALIQQELKIAPETVRENCFYYYGDARLNRILKQYDYHPASQNPDDFFTHIVRISPPRSEEKFRRLGVSVLLRGPCHWVGRGSLRQLRELSSRGYDPHSIGEHDLQPRQIKFFADFSRGPAVSVPGNGYLYGAPEQRSP